MKIALVGARKSAAIAAIAIASVVTLAGCSNDVQPVAAETSTTTVTTTQEKTVTSTVKPKPFSSCEEAKQAGKPNAKQDEAGYNVKLDTDKDGVICNEETSTSTSPSAASATPTTDTVVGAGVGAGAGADADTRPHGFLSNPEPAPRKDPAPAPAPAATYYASCGAARAAGAAPLYAGQPGYRSGLDRDGDGVACE